MKKTLEEEDSRMKAAAHQNMVAPRQGADSVEASGTKRRLKVVKVLDDVY